MKTRRISQNAATLFAKRCPLFLYPYFTQMYIKTILNLIPEGSIGLEDTNANLMARLVAYLKVNQVILTTHPHPSTGKIAL